MRTIPARNVNDAFVMGMNLLWAEGVWQTSRAGRVKVCPFPVTTIYERPMERVLFNTVRDANPFFHLYEALWMLSGSRDATLLDPYVSDFSARFAEEDGFQHGAYGYRWRRHFEPEGGWAEGRLPDQLDTVVDMLKRNPDERRAVLTMWDPIADLNVNKRDIPCNTHAYLRIRPGIASVLDITVCCRSNDAVWGAYGANAVHFSVLQEYLAQRLGIGMGVYYQVSNNFHVYEDIYTKFTFPLSLGVNPYDIEGIKPTPLELADISLVSPQATAIAPNVAPLFEAHHMWKFKRRNEAMEIVKAMPTNSDWGLAALQWMERRLEKVKS